MTEHLKITYRGLVYPWHCDHNNHMNVMWYVGKFDEATWHLLGLCGGTAAYMKKENRGLVAAEQRLVYRKELLAGERICIRSGMTEVKEKTFRFFHEMINEDTNEIAAITWLRGVHIDAVLRKACPMPDELRKNAEALITEYQPKE